MSHQGEVGYQRMLCKSEYEHCEQCGSKISPGETFQVKPPPRNGPLSEGWSDRRCYPHCEQAAMDRAARTTPYPEVDMSPHTETFPSRYHTNWCFVCQRRIRFGELVTATKHDGRKGEYQRLWHDMHHVSCPPVVSPSRSVRVPADDSNLNASIVAETGAEGSVSSPGVQEEENDGVEVNTEEGNGSSPGVQEEENDGVEVNTEEGNGSNPVGQEEENDGVEVNTEEGNDSNPGVQEEENDGVEVDTEEGNGSSPGGQEEENDGVEVNTEEGNGSNPGVQEEENDGVGVNKKEGHGSNPRVKTEENGDVEVDEEEGHGSNPGVKKEEGCGAETTEEGGNDDGHLAVKREEGGSLEAAEVERSARTRPASGDSSSSGPPTKRSRIASQPITERETAPATASNNSSAPANNDENGINDQESGPSSSPSQRQPNSAVAAASPTSACAGEVSAALLGVAAPSKPARSREGGGSRTVPGEVQDEVSCNLGVAEGWVVDSSSSSKSPPVKVEPPITG